jgi:FkbM family methyltransferase
MNQLVKNLFFRTQGLIEVLKYFHRPWSVILLRLGINHTPYFFYTIAVRGKLFGMLARPSSEPLSDINVLRTVLVQEEYKKILSHLPCHPLRIVDVGSNIGSFAVWICSERNVKEIYCFEPDGVSERICSFNIEENKCRGALTFQKAVGGSSRLTSMPAISKQPSGQNIYAVPHFGDTQTVEVTSLDEWLIGMNGFFDLLKLDCEGAEWEIVRKTPADALLRFGLIVAEIHDDPDEIESPADFHKHLEKYGFVTILNEGFVHGLYIGAKNKH